MGSYVLHPSLSYLLALLLGAFLLGGTDAKAIMRSAIAHSSSNSDVISAVAIRADGSATSKPRRSRLMSSQKRRANVSFARKAANVSRLKSGPKARETRETTLISNSSGTRGEIPVDILNFVSSIAICGSIAIFAIGAFIAPVVVYNQVTKGRQMGKTMRITAFEDGDVYMDDQRAPEDDYVPGYAYPESEDDEETVHQIEEASNEKKTSIADGKVRVVRHSAKSAQLKAASSSSLQPKPPAELGHDTFETAVVAPGVTRTVRFWKWITVEECNNRGCTHVADRAKWEDYSLVERAPSKDAIAELVKKYAPEFAGSGGAPILFARRHVQAECRFVEPAEGQVMLITDTAQICFQHEGKLLVELSDTDDIDQLCPRVPSVDLMPGETPLLAATRWWNDMLPVPVNVARIVESSIEYVEFEKKGNLRIVERRHVCVASLIYSSDDDFYDLGLPDHEGFESSHNGSIREWTWWSHNECIDRLEKDFAGYKIEQAAFGDMGIVCYAVANSECWSEKEKLLHPWRGEERIDMEQGIASVEPAQPSAVDKPTFDEAKIIARECPKEDGMVPYLQGAAAKWGLFESKDETGRLRRAWDETAHGRSSLLFEQRSGLTAELRLVIQIVLVRLFSSDSSKVLVELISPQEGGMVIMPGTVRRPRESVTHAANRVLREYTKFNQQDIRISDDHLWEYEELDEEASPVPGISTRYEIFFVQAQYKGLKTGET